MTADVEFRNICMEVHENAEIAKNKLKEECIVGRSSSISVGGGGIIGRWLGKIN